MSRVYRQKKDSALSDEDIVELMRVCVRASGVTKGVYDDLPDSIRRNFEPFGMLTGDVDLAQKTVDDIHNALEALAKEFRKSRAEDEAA